MSKLFRYVTREHLIEISKLGLEWDFNRQISEKVAELPDQHYLITFTMIHHHRHFEPCEPHMRCIVDAGDTGLIFDVPMDYFKRLPTINPYKKKAKEKTATAKDVRRIFKERGNVSTNAVVKLLSNERLSVSNRLIAAERKAMFGSKPTFHKVGGSVIRRSARGPMIVGGICAPEELRT